MTYDYFVLWIAALFLDFGFWNSARLRPLSYWTSMQNISKIENFDLHDFYSELTTCPNSKILFLAAILDFFQKRGPLLRQNLSTDFADFQ